MRQVLSEKRCRKYSRDTGLEIERMLARGGMDHWILFRTYDDRHGMIHAGNKQVEWLHNAHWSSCPGHSDFNPATSRLRLPLPSLETKTLEALPEVRAVHE